MKPNQLYAVESRNPQLLNHSNIQYFMPCEESLPFSQKSAWNKAFQNIETVHKDIP